MTHRALRPLALLGHLLVLAVAATCVTLGQWQLDRLAQVREANALATERLAQPPIDLATLVAQGPDGLDVDALHHRRVEATGTYRPHEEVLQRNQELHGRGGFRVLTPLELADGGVVLVVRGWVPPDLDEPPVAAAAPPTGQVTVDGVLERSVSQPTGLGARDPDEGRLARVFHADTGRLARQVEGELFPMVLRTTEALTAVQLDALPAPIGPPRFDEGNHLSYAVQWHVFAILAVVTYGAWLVGQRRRGPRPGSRPPSSPPSGPTPDHEPDHATSATP